VTTTTTAQCDVCGAPGAVPGHFLRVVDLIGKPITVDLCPACEEAAAPLWEGQTAGGAALVGLIAARHERGA
jgi:uncharacterized protein YlaI